MKNKPVSHKNENTFKFQTFSERLSYINIDVVRRIGRTSANPEDASTFFQEAIEKWNDLNYTEHFVTLRREIGFGTQTLPQVVYRKDELLNILLKNLDNPENMALDAVFEFVIALARDLQFEFYPIYPKFFMALTKLLQTKDTELLEKIFTCLSYLFKFLWRYMSKDMENTYSLFSNLLSDENREHIRQFAAESFAFLIRKVQDKPKFFQYIFQELKDNPKKTDGISQLLFEVVKGVKGQFHSCVKLVFKLLLQCLGNAWSTNSSQTQSDIPFEIVEKALQKTITCMAKHVSKTHATVVEEAFCESIMELIELLEKHKGNSLVTFSHLNHVLNLLLIWIDYKDAHLISRDTQIFKAIIETCHIQTLPDSCIKSLMKLTSSFMLSPNVSAPVPFINALLDFCFQCSNRKLTFEFAMAMMTYGLYEKDILPRLSPYAIRCLNGDPDAQSDGLRILTKVVTSLKPLEMSWDGIKRFSSLNIHTPSNLKTTFGVMTLEEYLLKTLEKNEDTISELPKIWSSLVCFPHLRTSNSKLIMDKIEDKAKILQQWMVQENQISYEEKFENAAFVLCEAFFAWLCLGGISDVSSTFSLEFFVASLKCKPGSVSLLRMFGIFLTSLKEQNKHCTILENKVCDIFPLLIPNLASPFHMVRLLTLQILDSFSLELPVSEDGDKEDTSVFRICLDAEKVPITVQDYREKLKWLRKLEFPYVKKYIPVLPEDCEKAPIYYLLGQLFINFRLLWDPSLKLLTSYAEKTSESFWMVFKPNLYKAIDSAEKLNIKGLNVYTSSAAFTSTSEESTFDIIFESLCKHHNSPDVLNYRNLLWKVMGNFPVLVKQKNPDVVPLLFQFIKNEFSKVDTMLAETETVLISDSNSVVADSVNQDGDMDDDGENNVNEDVNVETEENKIYFVNLKKQKISRNLNMNGVSAENEIPEELATNKAINSFSGKRKRNSLSQTSRQQGGVVKTLAVILSLFAKLKKPKSLHCSEDLQQLYCELLTYQDSEIQKLSFDCLMSYHYDYLVPYRDNFYNILDDKTFKTEIVLFSLDKDSEVIKENHRMKALSVLMRILYGKMLHKTGNNTTGKSQAHTRRTLVLRFLAGCRAEELRMFFDLVFAPFHEQLTDDVLTAVRKIRRDINLSSVVPIRKFSSALNTLEIILQDLGSLVPQLLPWLLKVLLVIATTSSSLLGKREELLPHCVTLLKKVRKLSVMRLIQFFKTFEHYNFSSDEIDAIFESVIWPALKQFQNEAWKQPPPIMRLFDTWSDNPRYFVLLAKQNVTSQNQSPLFHLVSLYASEHVRPKVVGLLSKMFLQLFTFPDYEPMQVNEVIVPPLPVIVDLPDIPERNSEETDMKGSLSIGGRMLYPYITLLLNRLQIAASKASKSKKKVLSSSELSILLRISEYVEDSDHCSQLILLLVSNFNKAKRIRTDSEVLILSTICNLLKQVKEPRPFLKYFSPLFGSLSGQRSRSSLTKVICVMTENDKSLETLSSIVQKITAWNVSFVEEPDYQTRLDGHKEALEIVNEMSTDFDEDFIQILIFYSCHTIRKCEDLSLRDSASYLLQKLVKKLSTFLESHMDLFAKFVFDTLLPEIKKSLRSKTEVIRCEFIRIFSALLRDCGSHSKLSSISQLCSTDADMDFWENILHLQVHRRARALLRFSTSLNSSEIVILPHQLVSYIIPIVSSFFFDASYNKHVHVVDAAIETLKSITRCLPWPQYESLLRQYLNLLSKDVEHHKTIIKIVVAILDSFHFDLSSSRGVIRNKNPPTGKAQKVEMMPEDDKDGQHSICGYDKKLVNSQLPPAVTESSKKNTLHPEQATAIHNNIVKRIIPQLRRSLMQKAKSDDEHKLAGASHPEDEEILRVPIAIAIVKLLQNLPHDSLKSNIPWLFLRMCQLLKSRSESIRETTRNTLVKMLQALGPNYFWFLLNEMRGIFKRGYQVHVMNYTVNTILQNLTDQMKSGDLDACIEGLTEICSTEMFGDTAEEKEVAKITGKCKEARSSKSYSLYELLGQFSSEECLGSIVSPLKEVLTSARSHKTVKKVQECLRHIALGVSENTEVTAKGLLIFTYSVISENYPLMAPKKNPPQYTEETRYVRPNIYLIPKEPGRSGPPAKTSVKANVHVMVDFSLQLLHFCLKREKLVVTEQEHLEMLDPFVPILVECLESNNVKVVSMSLRCFPWLFKFHLPSLKANAPSVVKSCFILLSKYAGVGMGQGENFELVIMCFKMLTIVVRDTDYHTLNSEQLHVLLSYIEQDIYDHTRQATAFTLLKAILSKKLQSPELEGIMGKISEMAIVSEQEHIRSQCRQVSLHYIHKYALAKNLQHSIGFYVTQLEYAYEHGRVSAIEMLNFIMDSFADNVVKKHSGLIFVPLAARLVNDESPKCRKMASASIKKMLNKVEHDTRTGLFSIALTWLSNKKLAHQRLGAQLCGIFAEVEGNTFEHHLENLLPIFKQILQDAKITELVNQVEERCSDHFLYHVVVAFKKVLSNCNLIRNKKFSSDFNVILDHLQELILHPHLWVRLAVSQCFGQLFSNYLITEVLESIECSKEDSIFFASRKKLRDLSADFATQFQSPCFTEALGDQVIKNLTYLSRVIAHLPELDNTEINGFEKIDEKEPNNVDVSVSWMVRKLCREVKKEVAHSPEIFIKRTCVFKFLAAVSVELDKEKIMPLLANIFTPLCRELSDSSAHTDQSIKSLAQEVLEVLKNVIGVEEFTKVFAIVQSTLVKKKVKRKQERVAEAVTNPERYACKKIKKQQNKKEAKKRKILKQKGKKKTKKVKLSQLVIDT